MDRMREVFGTAHAPAGVPVGARAWLLPVGLALAALALRLHGLGDKPFWLDELLTLRRVGLPLGDLIADAFRNRHFPSYFLLLRAVVPGDAGEWALRLPSALFGAAAVGMAAGVAQAFAGWRAGLAAGLLLALSPFDVQFGQEARSYTLVSALVLLALWGLARLVRDQPAAARPLFAKGAPTGAWAAYALGTAGGLCVLNVAIPWAVAANLAMILVLWRAGAARRGIAVNWALVQGFILLVWLPLLIAMSSVGGPGLAKAVEWVPPVNGSRLWSTLASVYLFRITNLLDLKLLPSPVTPLGFVVVALALYGLWRLRRDRPALAVLGLGLLALPVTILGASPIQSLLVPRYLMWGAGPFMILAGIGVAGLRGRAYAALIVALAVAGALNLAPYYTSETKARWDLAAARLSADLLPEDAVLVESPAARSALAYYLKRQHREPIILIAGNDNDRALAHRAAGGRVWLVYGRVGQGIMQPAERFLASRLSALGPPTWRQSVGRQILLVRFDPTRALA